MTDKPIKFKVTIEFVSTGYDAYNDKYIDDPERIKKLWEMRLSHLALPKPENAKITVTKNEEES